MRNFTLLDVFVIVEKWRKLFRKDVNYDECRACLKLVEMLISEKEKTAQIAKDKEQKKDDCCST